MRDKKYKSAVIMCIFLIMTVFASAGCSSKYEEIKLETQSTAAQTEETPALSDETHPLSEETSTLSEEVEAVADTSVLESDVTMDSGFTDADETVYITQNLVNLRADRSTDSKIIVQLNEGDSIRRTGYSDGWSRVLYKDNVCYVSSKFIKTESLTVEAQSDVQALANAVDMAEAPAAVSNGRIIAIDAGHQAKGDSEKEPVGPGSATMKAKIASGTEGVSTKLPEYKLTLTVSEKLKRILEERGYQVVMIRDSHDVNISNAERAKLANESGAALFVRVHANSVDNSTISGVLTMCQSAGNPYNGDLHGKSYALSRKITDHISSVTGFKNRGVQETDSMSGINWCTIPVSIVEMGFMSNPEEDEKMAQEEYQEMIAGGIADGIDAYFAE